MGNLILSLSILAWAVAQVSKFFVNLATSGERDWHYLLTGGGPDSLDYYFAGKTDLLITWLYRLTITQKDYNLGSVIGIMTFIVLAVTSLLTFHQTSAYKDEGAFQ